MNRYSKATTLLILIWMTLVIVVFVLVTIPAESSLNAILPDFYWQLRELIYPFFYSPSDI